MKKLFLLFLFLPVLMFSQSISPGAQLRDSSGFKVTVDKKKIAASSLASGGASAQAISDSIKANAIKTSSVAGFPTYWVTTDSMSWYKPAIQIPFDSSYINVTDTSITGMFPFPIKIDSMSFVSQMSTGSNITYKVLYGTNMLTGWTAVVSAGSATTSITTGDMVTSLNNSTLATGSRFAVLFSSVTTKPKKAVLTIFYHLN